MYHYQLYHLRLASDFLLQGMPEAVWTDCLDVVVRAGTIQKLAKDLPDTIYKPATIINKNLYYLEVAGIARYQVNGKHEVIIEQVEGACEKDVMAFFFDTILTVLLLKHNQFVFHAAAVKGEKGAILICQGRCSGTANFPHHDG